MRRTLTVLVVMGACGAGACIIGPKQDDPNSDEVPVDDVGGSLADTTPDFAAADTGASTDTETPPFTADGDAKADGDARPDGDAAADAVTDAAEGG